VKEKKEEKEEKEEEEEKQDKEKEEKDDKGKEDNKEEEEDEDEDEDEDGGNEEEEGEGEKRATTKKKGKGKDKADVGSFGSTPASGGGTGGFAFGGGPSTGFNFGGGGGGSLFGGGAFAFGGPARADRWSFRNFGDEFGIGVENGSQLAAFGSSISKEQISEKSEIFTSFFGSEEEIPEKFRNLRTPLEEVLGGNTQLFENKITVPWASPPTVGGYTHMPQIVDWHAKISEYRENFEGFMKSEFMPEPVKPKLRSFSQGPAPSVWEEADRENV
jgi:hypothetical protein